MRHALLLIGLAACIPPLEKPIMRDDPGQDFDGDGFTELEGDCDDLSQLASPAGDERCDGVDNDCDGVIDGDAAIDRTLWYNDADGDGFGDATQGVKTCERPAGWVENSADCDDTDAAINPETVWYADRDADGFGDLNAPLVQCKPANHYVQNTDDCDDTDATIAPGATELCWDGVDQDCDGLTPSCLGRADLLSPGTTLINLGPSERFAAAVVQHAGRLWIGSPAAEGHVYGLSISDAPSSLSTDDADRLLTGPGLGEALQPFGEAMLLTSAADQLYLWPAPLASGTVDDLLLLAQLSAKPLLCPGVDLNGDDTLDLVFADDGGLQVFLGPLTEPLGPPDQAFAFSAPFAAPLSLNCGLLNADSLADVALSTSAEGGTLLRFTGSAEGLVALAPLHGPDVASEFGHALLNAAPDQLLIGAPGLSAVFTLAPFNASAYQPFASGPIGSRLGEGLLSGLDLTGDQVKEPLLLTPLNTGYFFDRVALNGASAWLGDGPLALSLNNALLLTDLNNSGPPDLIVRAPSNDRLLIHWDLQP